jgi:hypothetical protein
VQAAEKRQRERTDAAEGAARASAELAATLASPLLNEAAEPSAFGAHRILPYAYKVSQSVHVSTCVSPRFASALALLPPRQTT